MSKRLTELEVKERLSSQGLTLLSDFTKVTAKTAKVDLLCNCGLVFNSNLSYVIQSKMTECIECKRWYKLVTKYVGKRFDKVLIIGVINSNDFLCECACGYQCIKTYEQIYNTSYSGGLCNCGCEPYSRFNKGKNNSRWRGTGELSQTKFGWMKKGARNRSIPFNLTIEEAWFKCISQKNKCALSGSRLTFAQDPSANASLDRIDPQGAYEPKNVWWIHKALNQMKWDLTLDRFLELCKLVTYPIKSEKPYDSILVENYTSSFKGYGNLNKTLWSKIQIHAQDRNINFDLRIQEAWALFVEQKGYCAVTGLPIYFKPAKNTASLDRIDSSLGYVLSNVQWVHKEINTKLKMQLDTNTMKYWCKKITDFQEQKESVL